MTLSDLLTEFGLCPTEHAPVLNDPIAKLILHHVLVNRTILLATRTEIMTTLADVKAAADAVQAAVVTAVASMDNLAVKLAAALAVTPTDPAALQAIADELTATASTLNAAVAKDDPAPPAPVPAPEPAPAPPTA